MRPQQNTAARRRKQQLAKIHIGANQLGLDRDTYESMLWTIARVRSARDLDEAGRDRVLQHLRARGFRERNSGRPHNARRSPQIRKIEALLADAKRPWKYADAMAQRMFKVDRVAFCRPDQLTKLIAALTYDAQRRMPQALPTGSASGALESDEDQSDAADGAVTHSSSASDDKTPTAGGDESCLVTSASRGQHSFTIGD